MWCYVRQLFEARQRESARLAQFIRWSNLFGRHQPTEEDVTADSAQATSRAVAEGLDANDRMYILVSPHPTAASLVAVRSVIQVTMMMLTLTLRSRSSVLHVAGDAWW